MKTKIRKSTGAARQAVTPLARRASAREDITTARIELIPSVLQIKSILVPIDFSDCAKKALQYAIPLAKEHEAAITLLYVAPTN